MIESNRSHSVLALAALTWLCSFLSGCPSSKGEPPSPGSASAQASASQAGAKPIVIGSLLALSGKDQSFGITERRGIEMAVDEVNADGGIGGAPLRVEFADTRLEEDLGLQEYKRLTGSLGLNAIVGVTGSGIALRIAPYANEDKVVLLSPLDTSPKLTRDGGPYFFRNIASDAYSGVVLSKWALERGHKSGAVVFNTENAWSQGCKASVEEAFATAGGLFVVASFGVVDSAVNFSAAIASIRAAKTPAQGVFVCLMGRQGGMFASQAASSRLGVDFYGTDPFSQQEFVDNAGDGKGRSFFVLPAEANGAAFEKFTAVYTERYHGQPDSIAAKAHDALHLMAIALRGAQKKGALTGEAIRAELARASYNGITGPNAFDENGDLKEARFDRFTYKDGKRSAVP